MKYKKIKVYKFEELKENIQEKVLNNFRENNDLMFLDEYLNNYLEELLIKYKILVNNDKYFKLYYSLSYCQGDGVCFIGNFEYKNFKIKIEHNFNYYHKRSTDIYIYKEDKKGNEIEVTEKQEEHFKNIYYEICDLIEKAGYDYIDSENSEENIKELISINEYTFRDSGEMENI